MSEQLIDKNEIGKIACFGKIRAKGDFVSRNLDYQVQEYLDTWLQSSFGISQQQIGDDWLKFYLTSPIWRFVIRNRKMNKDIVGFMMPSIDKVGRYYPLFMLEVFEDGKLCGGDLYCKSFEELEEMAMSTLDGSDHSIGFFEGLNRAGFPLLEEQPPVSELLQRLTNFDEELDNATMRYLWQQPGNFMSLRYEDEASTTIEGVWWTEGSEAVNRSVIYCSGLPPVDGYSAMLDGKWEHWGWQERNNKEEEETFAAE